MNGHGVIAALPTGYRISLNNELIQFAMQNAIVIYIYMVIVVKPLNVIINQQIRRYMYCCTVTKILTSQFSVYI